MNVSGAGRPVPHLSVTPDDHRANLWITALLCLSIINIALLTRWMAKLRFSLKLDTEDYAILGSYVLAVVQHALLMVALTKGLGTNLSKVHTSDVASVERYFYASQIFLLVSLYVSKCAMVLVFKRIFQFSPNLNFVHGFFILSSIIVALVASANCSPAGSLSQDLDRHCPHRQTRWVVVTVFDVLTEVILFILPIIYFQPVQLSFAAKAKLVLALSTRLSIILFAALFIWAYSHFVNSDDPGVQITVPSIFQQCNLAASFVIVSILPVFRFLFQSSELIPQFPLSASTARTDRRGTTVTAPGPGETSQDPPSPRTPDAALTSNKSAGSCSSLVR